MDPHYRIIPAQEAAYDTVPPPNYDYSAPHAYTRDDPYSQATSQGQPYDGSGILTGHPAVAAGSYPSYPSSAQAMEYVQSMYQMQIAQEMAAGFSDSNPYTTRTIISSDGRRKRRRIITHEQRKAANIRERRRMFHLNEAFDQLRKRVPTFAYEKKLSRIETLKLAVTYIKFMGDLVTELGGKTTTLDLSTSTDDVLEEDAGSPVNTSSEDMVSQGSSDHRPSLLRSADRRLCIKEEVSGESSCGSEVEED